MRFRALAVTKALTLLAAVAGAQTKPTAPLVLRLPASTRALALGDVNVASTNDDVLFYNPAQLAAARSASLSMQQFEQGVAGAVSAAIAFNNGGIGVGAQWVSFYSTSPLPFSPFNVTERGGPTASSAAMTVGVGQVVKGIRIGIAAKVSQEMVSSERSVQLLGDVGAAKDLRFLAVALAFRNLGASSGIPGPAVTPPSRMTLGLQFARPLALLMRASPFVDIGVVGELSVLRDGWLKPAGGLELGYNWIDGYSLLLRGGIRRPELGERAATAGAGLIADRVRVDYALEPREGGTVSHRFGLRIR